ncbi:restriction endonuclease [Brevibacillus sp. FSL K6-6036]|jgi:restriction system protein|uniref:restriction endonuclease n=1 Tax=Brevibacillus TaxID=55080 RepID=UPI001FAA8A27|nr:restriction endonuclease [Brevibacillus borstelensis]
MLKWSKKELTNIENLIRGILVISSASICFAYNLGYLFFFGSIGVSLVLSVIIGSWLARVNNQGKAKQKKNGAKKELTKRNHKTEKQSRKPLSDQELLTADIDSLSGPDFERLMEAYYRDKGYQVERVGGSGDNEVDLILQDKKGYKIAVQCKRWKKNVGNDIVLRLKAGKQVYGCYDAWIVTTSHFTKTAIEIAGPLNITLINGAQVHDMIRRWRKEKAKNMS